MTCLSVSARNVSGWTNSVACLVIATDTSQPDFCNRRITSTALYAAMPPDTPRPTRYFAMTKGYYIKYVPPGVVDSTVCCMCLRTLFHKSLLVVGFLMPTAVAC